MDVGYEGATLVAPPSDGVRDIGFAAADGFPLSGTLFEGTGSKPLLLISSATAVPRNLYVSFARAAIQDGARAVLIYDYRGTGGSARPKDWRGRISMKDWALKDFPAAARALDAVASGHPMVGLGQSFGGQAFGLCGISGRFARYGMVATMSGYFGGLDDPNAKWRMLGFGVPLSYLMQNTSRRFGVGEPIPSTVLRDWARWCSSPNYFFDDKDFPETSRYRNVRTPILALGMTDDVWGTERAIRALMRNYALAPVELRFITPEDAGGPIGHLGYFRSRFAQTLWPDLLGWLLAGEASGIGRQEPL
ncbi:MAG: alpha/beta fold hydrolase [Mesorhizobium sp.]